MSNNSSDSVNWSFVFEHELDDCVGKNLMDALRGASFSLQEDILKVYYSTIEWAGRAPFCGSMEGQLLFGLVNTEGCDLANIMGSLLEPRVLLFVNQLRLRCGRGPLAGCFDPSTRDGYWRMVFNRAVRPRIARDLMRAFGDACILLCYTAKEMNSYIESVAGVPPSSATPSERVFHFLVVAENDQIAVLLASSLPPTTLTVVNTWRNETKLGPKSQLLPQFEATFLGNVVAPKGRVGPCEVQGYVTGIKAGDALES